MSLDQFYTKNKVAAKCLSHLDLTQFKTIIEPACGTGSFLDLLPKNALGIDIEPKCVGNILAMNFFDYHPTKITGPVLVVGNPPFGRTSNLAVRFFNHAAKIADCIAFIVPATFQKLSVMNRLDFSFRLKANYKIPIGSFIPETMKARCVFQIWKKSTRLRNRKVVQPSGDFWSCGREIADIALKAYGGTGDCGTIISPDRVINQKAYHFLAVKNNRVIERLKQLPFYPLAAFTVRQDSLGLKDLNWLYNKKLESEQDEN